MLHARLTIIATEWSTKNLVGISIVFARKPKTSNIIAKKWKIGGNFIELEVLKTRMPQFEGWYVEGNELYTQMIAPRTTMAAS